MAEDPGDPVRERDAAYYAVNWANAQIEAPTPTGVGGGGFVVDPERAQVCIAELTRIVNEVRAEAGSLNVLAFRAPGADEVSLNLARNGGLMARRAEQFVRVWADQIEVTRDGLQRQLDAYRAAEDANRRSLA